MLPEQFQKAVKDLITKATSLQAAYLWGHERAPAPSAIDRIVSYGLSSGRTLLDSPAGVNALVKLGGMQVQITRRLGRISLPNDFEVLIKNIHYDRIRTPQATRPSVSYVGSNMIAAYSMPQRDEEGYLVFFDVAKELSEPATLAAVGTFIQIFEAVLTTTMTIDFLEDQKRLLSRRTIVAQFRPNDLFYQALRRLHKYVGWERNALILGPWSNYSLSVDDVGTQSALTNEISEWYIAAERVRGVNEVSQRVGKRFELDQVYDGFGGAVFEPRVIESVNELTSEHSTRWDRLVYRVLTELEGLPSHLPNAGSALVVPIGTTGDMGRNDGGDIVSPFIVILCDPRIGRFTTQHCQLVQAFFSDVIPLLKKSGAVSERLIKLWTPAHSHSAEDTAAPPHPDPPTSMEHPDIIEALDGERALPDEALEVLGVDSLQVVQLRRGSIRKVSTGKLDLLVSISVEKGGAQERLQFLRNTHPNAITNSKADILWRVFTERQEFALKDSASLKKHRFANLIPSTNPENAYRTVLVVPIESEGEFAGALLAYRKKLSEFIDVDRILIRSLAARLGEQIELHRKLADRVRLVACLFRVATAPDSNAARRSLVEGAREILNSDHVFMMEVKDPLAETDRAYAPEIDEVAHTWEDGRMYVRRIKASIEGITGNVFMSGEPLAVPDVAGFETYVPIHTRTGRIVKVASELAVPIKAPFMSGEDEGAGVLGVLDALWTQPHQITLREVDTLRALAGHAAALLQLTTGLQVALTMRQSLQKLLHDAIELQEAKTQTDVMEWLASTILGDGKGSGLIDCDMVILWEHERYSNYMNVLLASGPRAEELKRTAPVRCTGSWTADVIRRFREGELRSAFDYYDRPANQRRHIPGTRKDKHQSIVARCIIPTSAGESDGTEEPNTIWAVSLYRFRKSNFNEHEGVLLQFAAEYCEAALQKLGSNAAQVRSFELARASQDVALKMISGQRLDQREVVDYICERVYVELQALSVAILYYESGTTTAPTYFSYPRTNKQSDAPRRNGLSEAVRLIGGITTVSDVKHPPPDIAKTVRNSPFLEKHRDIRSFIAVPLFELPETSTGAGFFGVMYINFAEVRTVTKTELEFLSIMQRFLAECGGIEGKLLHMRAEALSNVQRIEDPSQVFKHILSVALNTLRFEFPAAVRNNPQFTLGGNLYMVTQGKTWAKLRVRHNIGQLTGKQAGVQEIGEGVVGLVAKSGESKLVGDTKSEASLKLGYLPYLKDMRSELAVPITLPNAPDLNDKVAGGVIGVINVECSVPNMFTARHQSLLMRFSASPVALILYLAERHGQRLWQVRQDEDDFLMNVALLVMHDLTRPMVNLGLQVSNIRKDLPRAGVKQIDGILKQMERESQVWVEFRKTGLHFLKRKILNERCKLDIIEQVSAWAATRKVRVYRPRVREFFIPKGHPELIASIMENLYSNSIRAQQAKLGQRAGRVWITMEVTPEFSEAGPYIDIFVHDNGPGITGYNSENWGELFRPFEYRRRAVNDRRTKVDGGWGWGLPVIRQMTHLMGGTVDIVDSRPFEKTTFRLRFMAQPISERR